MSTTVRFRDGHAAELRDGKWTCTDQILERMLNAVQNSFICPSRATHQDSVVVDTIVRLFNGKRVDSHAEGVDPPPHGV